MNDIGSEDYSFDFAQGQCLSAIEALTILTIRDILTCLKDKMIRKRTWLPTILCYFICVSQAEGIVCPRNNNYYYPNGLATATGTVQANGRNSIKIYDEDQKRVGRYIYFEHGEMFHQGEYVRVYYNPQNLVVRMIKRMTVLDYKKNGRNLGYISRGALNVDKTKK